MIFPHFTAHSLLSPVNLLRESATVAHTKPILKPNDFAKVLLVYPQVFASPFGGSITFSEPLFSCLKSIIFMAVFSVYLSSFLHRHIL